LLSNPTAIGAAVTSLHTLLTDSFCHLSNLSSLIRQVSTFLCQCNNVLVSYSLQHFFIFLSI